jgi:hypothetical protein
MIEEPSPNSLLIFPSSSASGHMGMAGQDLLELDDSHNNFFDDLNNDFVGANDFEVHDIVRNDPSSLLSFDGDFGIPGAASVQLSPPAQHHLPTPDTKQRKRKIISMIDDQVA